MTELYLEIRRRFGINMVGRIKIATVACILISIINLLITFRDISVSDLFNSLLWVAAAVVLIIKEEKVFIILFITWWACIIKETVEFILCVKNMYSYFLLFTLLFSGILILKYYNSKRYGKLDRRVLKTGIGVFAIRELVICCQISVLFIDMLPFYRNPFQALVKLYLRVLVYIVWGGVTWLQKEI